MARTHFVLLTLALSALPLQGQSSKPLWEVDLSRFGYGHRPPAALAYDSLGAHNSFKFSSVFQQGISFTDPSVVAAFFVVYDTPAPASEPRGPITSDSFRLVAVFLNAKNGELIKQLDWPLPHDHLRVSQSFFYPAAQGRFIVVLGNTVNLYSSEFNLLAHFEAHGEMIPTASPSGTSLLLQTTDGQTVQYDLLDAKNLSVLTSWSDSGRRAPFQLDSLWDDRISWKTPAALYFRTADSEPKKLLAIRHGFCDAMQSAAPSVENMCAAQESVLTVSGDFCREWRFVGKDSVTGTICSGDNKLLTVSTDGKITREFNLGLEREDGAVIPSANGHRFVLPSMRWGLGKNDTPDKQTARVFDLGFENPVLTLSLPRSQVSSRGLFYSYGDTRFGWGGLALSPDGNLLAVQSGPTIRIYTVPDQPPAAQYPQNCSSPAALSNVPPPHPHPVWSPASPLVERMLSWFPADTETLTGVTGPLKMPKTSRDANGGLSMDSSDDLVRDTFRQLFLLPALRLEKEFKDTSIAAAMEGSRTFRPPSGLGMASYQGGLIAVFTEDVTVQASAFIKDSASTAVRAEQIAGLPVEVFQEKSEEDILTTYVAFPKPNIVVVATDEGYLREVLGRIGGKEGERALPDTLPEWKRVDTNATFWAVRHFSKTEATNWAMLPSCRVGHSTDEKPIGLTFSFSPGPSNVATIDYLSGDEGYLRCIQGGLFRQSEPGVAEMRMQYSEAQSGVLEGSYNLDEFESARYFAFVLEALLGHPIYV